MATITAEADGGAAGPAPDGGASTGRPGWLRAVHVAGLAALALPFAVIGALVVRRPWLPAYDLALMEIPILDVGGPYSPLTGVYSRFGWHHPGPLAFWYLTVPYRLVGSRPVGLLLGAVAVHVVAVAGCLVLAHRRGGRLLSGLLALFLALVVRALGLSLLANFWNPYLPVLVVAFLALAVWSVFEGDLVWLPAAVLASCFAWQSHLGYLPATGALGVAAVVGAAVTVWRRRAAAPWSRRRLAAVGGLTVAVAAVCLAPIAVEQATNDPGNVTRIVDNLRFPVDAAVGYAGSARVLAAAVAPTGTWIAGDGAADPSTETFNGGSWWGLVPALLAAGAALELARRNPGGVSAPAARLLALVVGTLAVAFVAVARTLGQPYYYLFTWLRPLAMLLWLAILWIGIDVFLRRGVPERWPALARAGAVATALATVVVAVTTVADRGSTRLPDEKPSQVLLAIAPGTLAATAGQGRVRVGMAGGWCAWELGHGLSAQILEHGTEVTVSDSMVLEYGRRATADVAPTVELICGADTGAIAARTAIPPVAAHNLMSEAQRAELRALEAQFRSDIEAQGRPDLLKAVGNQTFVTVEELSERGTIRFDPAQVARYAELMEQARRSVVVYFWPGTPDFRPVPP